METIIIRAASGKHELEPAINAILRGGLVAFPTETVYGLGADAFNSTAVRRIYEVKGRPSDNPSIVHIASLDQLSDVAIDVPPHLYDVLRKVWPGPFTVILRKSPSGAPGDHWGAGNSGSQDAGPPSSIGLNTRI